jgi:hypothetical protein
MIQNVYLMPKLKNLMSNGKTNDVKRKAIATFTSMKKAQAPKEKKAKPAVNSEGPTTTTTSASAASAESVRPLQNVRRTNNSHDVRSFGFGASGSSAKNAASTITVFMKELCSENNKVTFERTLVNYKGIVSFWVELRTHKAVIRTTLTEDQLVKAISNQLGWIASTDYQYVAPGNDGYLEEELGENARIVPRASKKKAKEQAGSGWFSSVTSYIW